ncbi:MAG: DUF5818 domain-containing protein [Pseudomonadota bacterium]
MLVASDRAHAAKSQDSDSQSKLVRVSGVIEAGVGCPVIVAADGRRFSLTGAISSLRAGDRVRITGEPALNLHCATPILHIIKVDRS